MTRPVMLVVLDGFGIGDGGADDATARAHTPFLDQARREHPCARIETSGEAVASRPDRWSTPNSAMTMAPAGSSRGHHPDQPGAAGDALERNPALAQAFEAAARPGATLHLMGLVSDGGVHSHQEHLSALLAYCGKRGVRPAVHVFLDGRDTPPRSGLGYLRAMLPEIEACGGRVSTVIGRY